MKTIKYTISLLLLISLLFSFTSCSDSGSAPENIGNNIGQSAPDFSLIDNNDNYRMLSEFRGNVVYLDFWATWCYACREYVPELKELNEMMEDKDFELIGISLDYENTTDIWKKYINDNNMAWTQLINVNRSVTVDYNVEYIPYVFLIDKNGIIRQKGFPYEIRPTLIDSLLAE